MADYIVKCKQCGTIFKTDNQLIRYCSEKCKRQNDLDYHHARKTKENAEKFKDVPDIPTCKLCGFKSTSLIQHLFETHNMTQKTYMRKYKAKKHEILHESIIKNSGNRGGGKPTTCKQCGTEFVKTSSHQKYCSDACRKEVRKELNRKQKTAQPTPLTEKECRQCGKKYMPKGYYSHYCSPRCRDRWFYEKKSKGRKKQCAECGKDMPYHTLKKYCGPKCRKTVEDRRLFEKTKRKNAEKYKDNPDIPTCKICGYRAKLLQRHIRKHHNMTTEKYLKKFNVDISALRYENVDKQNKAANTETFKRRMREYIERTKDQRTDKYQNDFFD